MPTTVSNEPATKADLEILTSELQGVKADVQGVKADVSALETKLQNYATKSDLSQMCQYLVTMMREMETRVMGALHTMKTDLEASLARFVRAANEEMATWMTVQREEFMSALERHASDTTLHRQPRRRKTS